MYRFFLISSVMERIRKWGHRASNKIFAHQVSTKVTSGVLTIYKNHPVGNFSHKRKTIKCEVAGEGISISIKYIHIR